MHALPPTTWPASNSLLVWGGAPGTTSDGAELDPDRPARFTDASDDLDRDEHVDGVTRRRTPTRGAE